MSKKMMLLALAVASMAVFALPSAASAQEIHIEGATGFTGTGGAGALKASGEPTITCETTDVTNGVINSGGTTGSMTLDFTGCHATVLGFTVKCRTTGSTLDNTIASGGTLHAITVNSKPGVLVTANPTTVSCAGISSIAVEGNIIGTITTTKDASGNLLHAGCGDTSPRLTIDFNISSVTGNQEHIAYTGTNYDLTAKTSGGSTLTAALESQVTLTANSPTQFTVNCT